MSKRNNTARRQRQVQRYLLKTEVQMIHDAGDLANCLLAIDEARMRCFGSRLLSPTLRLALNLLLVEQ